MSLEQALAENTAVLKLVLAALQAGAALTPVAAATAAVTTPTAAAEAAGPTKATRGKAKTEQATIAAVAAVTNDGKSEMPNRLVDDPAGTRYFHIAKHNTVAKIKPGEVIPSIEGIEEVAGTQYVVWKTHYAAQVPSAGAAPSGSSAAVPASTSPAAPTASSSTPATSPQAVCDAKTVIAKCQELHKAQGNDGLLDVLKHFGVTRVPDLAAKSDALAEVVAYIDAKLAPPAAESNLFG